MTPDEYYRKQQEQANEAARQAALLASQPLTKTPDEYAQSARLAKSTGLPTAVIDPNYKTFAQKMTEKRNEMILGTAPVLTNWIAKDDNYKVAADDLEGLSWWEGGVTGAVTSALSRGIRRLPQSYYQWMAMGANERAQDQKRGFGEILSDERAVKLGDGRNLGPVGIVGPDDLLMAGTRWAVSRISNMTGVDNRADAVSYQQRAGQTSKNIAAIKMSEPGERFKAEFAKVGQAGDWTEQLRTFATAAANDPAGLLAFLGETSVESLPSIGAGAVAGVATRSPGVAAAAMGAYSGAVEYGSATEFFTEKGIDVSTPEGALAAISDPKLMQEADQRGVTRALVVGIMDGLSGGLAGKTLSASPMGNIALQSLAQAGMGAGGEAMGQAASGQQLNLGDIIVEGLAEFATAPIEVATIGGRRVLENRAKVREAATAQETINEISQMAQGSALRTRLPDAFRDYLGQALTDSPIENVYVPAQDFVEFFQGQGIDPYELADELDGVTRDDLDAALAGGGDLQIPTATYAAKIAGSDADGFLMENMRFSPDDMTAREAAEFNAGAEQAMQEAWAEAERVRQEDEALRGAEQQIYDEMQSRLRRAGRTVDVANTEALLYPAFYRTMAERSGLTTEEFLARYPLPQVEGVRPEGMQTKNVTEFNRFLAEARSRRAPKADTRQTLLEFISERGGINDVGGELRARDAATVKRGRGKKTLRLARDMAADGQSSFIGSSGGVSYSADDVALAAVEAGFMADNPVVMEWQAAQIEGRETPDLTAALWDAIDEELRGNAQTAGTDDIAGQEREQALDDLEAYLDRLGLSLDAADEEIRAAVAADEEQAGQRYAQVSPDQARAIEMAVEMPSDPLFAEAVANTPGAEITVDGLLIDLVRYQKDEQSGATSVRTGVFYLPTGAATVKHYKGGKNGYGGMVEARGETLLKRPLFVKGATGGKAPEAAYDAIHGKKAYENMRSAALKVVMARGGAREELGYNFLEEYGADGNLIHEILPASTQGNTLAYALQENVVAHAVREAGYDSVVGHTKAKGVPVISEVFDVREIDYPVPGEPAVLHPQFERDGLLFQDTGTGPRGSIQFPMAGIGNGETIINLSQRADLSTFLHETGHYFLTVLQDMAGQNIQVSSEPAVPAGMVRVYHSGSAAADLADGGRWVSTARQYASDYRGDLPFFYMDIPATDPRVINDDNPETIGMTFNFELTPNEAVRLTEIERNGTVNPVASEFATIKGWWRENAGDVAKDARRAFPDLAVTAEQVQAAIDTGTSGDAAIDAAIDVGMQEQFARGFEIYVMEGKAPSVELRSAFERFRAWLISIYRKLSGLGVNVNDDLRRVMDRMIATDEEIAQATDDAGGSAPLFATAEEMGLTPEEFDRFTKLRGQAEEEAKARLLKETMAPIKREREKWFKEERAQVLEDVERRINAMPAYRAIEWMGNRRWFGEEQPSDMPDMRLSKDVLVARYGEGILKTLPRGKQTVYAVEGGLDPDDAAGWFGFDSGDEMLRAMEQAQPRKEAIEAETDRVMYETHGDVLRDGSIEEEALAAVHNDRRGEWLAAELKAVVEVAGTDQAMTAKQARATARQTIARMRVRDAMAANRFLAAERKAGQEAAKLGAMLAREGVWMGNARRRIATKARAALREDGTVNAVAAQVEQANASTGNYNETVAKLIEAKRRQLLNHALYSEARKVTEEVGKAERFVAGLNKKSKRDRIAGAGRRENAQIDYLGAIDEILDQYDFRRMSGKAEERRGSLLAFVEGMKAAGRENELAIPDEVLTKAGRAPYKTIPVEEMRGVVDSLKNLEHVALRWNDLIDAQNKRDLDAAVDDVTNAFEVNVERRPPGRVGTTAEGFRNGVRQFFDLVLNATTLLREIDGFADFGAAYRNIKAPIDAAMSRLISRKEKAATDLDALYAVYSKAERREMAVRRVVPELGYALSKWEMIAVALNTGNEGNYQRLTDSRVRGSLTDDQVQAVLARLDARDAKFVQSVWDYLETFRDDIAERERRTTGVTPQFVEAKPIDIAGRTLKGGYYPLKYDPRLSSLARDDEAQDIATSLQAGRFGKAQTRNGHLKDRAQSSGRDVELDMSVLHRHVNQVIYDLELSEPVSNSWRILQNSRVRDQFIQTGKQADFDALEAWLKDVAEGEVKSADFVGRAARTLKSNFTAAKLAFNLSTVAMQITGLSQTMVVVGKRDFAKGVTESFRPGVIDEIAAKSPYMTTRQTTFNKDIYDFYSDPKMGPVASRWGSIKQEIIGPLSFWLMTKVQWHLVDVPTWLAGYNKGLRKFGNSEAQAIAYADDVVKRAQASGLFSDRSAIERGSVSRTARQNDVVRLFTTLASYMFAKFNVTYERSAQAAQTIRREGVSVKSAAEVLSWTVDMAFLFMLEAVVTAAIKGGLPKDDDEDDTWTKFLAKQTAFGVMGTVPFVRDVASTMSGFEGGGAYGGITKEVAAPFKEIAQGEVDKGLVKSVISTTGLATGLPATQINRAVDATWRQAEGEDVAPMEYLLGKSKK